MNNLFRPVSALAGGQTAHVDLPLAVMSANSGDPFPGPSKESGTLSPRPIVPRPPKRESKKGWLGKLFGGNKHDDEDEDEEEEETTVNTGIDAPVNEAPEAAPIKPPPLILPQKESEIDLMVQRHDELIKSIDEICRSLEAKGAQQVEVSLTDVLPPIPAETFDSLKDLKETQIQVAGALEKVADQMDNSTRKESLFMDSLTKMDGTLSALSRSSERSVTTMDGMKGLFSQIGASMESMKAELEKSSERYEKLCESFKEAEEERARTISSLQKNTLNVIKILGAAMVVGLLILILVR